MLAHITYPETREDLIGIDYDLPYVNLFMVEKPLKN
jgi:hypothetical protein